MTTTPDALAAAVEALREAHAKTTRGTWNLTTYSGGLTFAGKKTVFCGTDPNYGEPRRMPDTEADNEFVALAHNTLPALLEAAANWQRERGELERDNARLREAVSTIAATWKEWKDIEWFREAFDNTDFTAEMFEKLAKLSANEEAT